MILIIMSCILAQGEVVEVFQALPGQRVAFPAGHHGQVRAVQVPADHVRLQYLGVMGRLVFLTDDALLGKIRINFEVDNCFVIYIYCISTESL